MEYTIANFCVFLESYRDFLGDLLMLSKEKLRLLLNDDVRELEKLLKREQAMVMQIESFEKKRIDYQKKMNMADHNLSQIIISVADGAEQSALSLLYAEINFYISDIRELGLHVANITNDRLSFVRSQLDKGQLDGITVYDESGHSSRVGSNGPIIGGSI